MPNWTTDQLRAMQAHGSDVLVAAAAGSGKTAVLVERVLRQVLNAQNPVDIDRFLIVTYTNAAAAELRAKLAEALQKALVIQPENAHLRRQTLRVHNAPISTVHAFCMQLVREHATTLELPADFHMIDENEEGLIAQEVIAQVLEKCYTQNTADFQATCTLLASARDDAGLVDTVMNLARQLQAQPDPIRATQDLQDRLENSNTTKQCIDFLLDEAHLAMARGAEILQITLAELHALDEDDKLRKAYAPILEKESKCAQDFCALLLQTQQPADGQDPIQHALDRWQALTEQAQFSFTRLGSTTGYDDPARKDWAKMMRDKWKEIAQKVQSDLNSITPTQIVQDARENLPALRGLLQVVMQYLQALETAKRRRGLLSFADLEHNAIRLLYHQGAVSPLAQQLAQRYVGVLVDEYQDTNEVQDAIFVALSAQNRFMVGDVKQSIYRFRLANPYIFLGKYHAFTDAGDPDAPLAPDTCGQRVILSQNFRSRAQVLDTVNYLFRAVMSTRVGDLEYTAQEQLYVGATYYPQTQVQSNQTELLLLDSSANNWKLDKHVAEARMVAQRLKTMLDHGFQVYDSAQQTMRPAQMEDMCVLMRAPNSKISIWRTEFERVGLHLAQAGKINLLEAVEVRALLSLLEVLDNPHQDVPLIGVLRSPLFDFTAQELSAIRMTDRKVDLYDALQLSAQTQQKSAEFLQLFDQLRQLTSDLPVYRLLWTIYTRTNALAKYGALPNGQTRQQNLLSLLDYARKTEQAGGLFQFVMRMRAMLEQKQEIITSQPSTQGGVQLMSIHRSKGLEYPIVVLADTAHQFNGRERVAQVLLHNTLGVVSKRRDLDRNARFETLERLAVTRRMQAESTSEELRLLYVALTRAKEKLIISGVQHLPRMLPKWAELARQSPVAVYEMAKVNNYLSWIAVPLMHHESAAAWCSHYQVPPAQIETQMPEVAVTCQTIDQLVDSTTAQTATNVVEAVAPAVLPPLPAVYMDTDTALCNIPSKLTATGIRDLQGQLSDTSIVHAQPASTYIKQLRRPDFTHTQGLTASECGTAHHMFLQYCDFATCQKGEYVQELARLRTLRQLTPAQCDAIDLQQIANFFEHPTTKNLLMGKVHREVRFSVTLPACDYYTQVTDPAETVLLQGVIDCMVEQNGAFTIVDYKTDGVNRANMQARAQEYALQAQAYRKVVEKVYDKKVAKTLLFFTKTGDYCEIL